VRSLKSVLPDFPVECLGGYAENGRGATLVPAHALEDVANVDPFELFEGRHVEDEARLVRWQKRADGLGV
jgi:hypothetical protein